MAGHLMPFAAFLVKPKPGAAALLKIVLNPGRFDSSPTAKNAIARHHKIVTRYHCPANVRSVVLSPSNAFALQHLAVRSLKQHSGSQSVDHKVRQPVQDRTRFSGYG